MNNTHYTAQVIISEQNQYMVKVFSWMGAGLIVTALVAMWTINSIGLISPSLFFGGIIAEFFLVYKLSRYVMSMPVNKAKLIFIGFSALNGFTLSGLLMMYTTASIVSTFFIASSIFIFMALYGYTTKKDLTAMGSFLRMGLFGIFIAFIVNIFLQSNVMSLVISMIGVLVFTGLTAYDVQKISKLNIIGNAGTDEDTKEAILGALTLYLDFINLFIMLLRLLGDRK